ncbi:MAG: hypothetical protein V4628_08985 [Pseudomonadota bacterium]
MTAVISANNPNLLLLDELVDFQAQALKAVQQGRRQLCILSETLDDPLYNTDEFRDAVRLLVTQDRYAGAKFLVKDTTPLVEHGHRLLQLSRRLSGKVDIRKLTVAPQNTTHAWMTVDNNILLYKHDEGAYNGYIDYAAAPKCKLLLEEFINLWELYGEEDPNLRQQLL